MLKLDDWCLSPHDSTGFQNSKITAHVEAGSHTHHTEQLFFNTPKRYALINITERVEEAVAKSGVLDGFAFVSAMHITAGIYINDAESGLLNDIAEWIESLAPFGEDYRHHQTGEDNGDAHLKSFLTNHAVTLPITEGQLDLGTWQQLFYAEYDGRREKRVLLKITGISSKLK